MELKRYQKEVIDDIESFNNWLKEEKNLKSAFRNFWKDKGVLLSDNEYQLHEYNNEVPGVPKVTVKVPTAGGKTFIACNAIHTIFNSYSDTRPKVVAWFVPSDAILAQTYEKLSDPTHPYRKKLNTLFNGKVTVYDKQTLLTAQGFNPYCIQDQVSIMVLSIQSFASKTKDGRLSYRENENLTEFVSAFKSDTSVVEGADESSLIQVIANLNPVVIIDESHNFTANLRIETLRSINPKYILELTATPRNNSNIISFIDSIKLKRENMVKLPVIVYNHKEITDVIQGAINLQRSLEMKAQALEADGGSYIRPIVLFQAQPKNQDDNETYEKIKDKLVQIGIPENQIKIKTADKNQLKGLDLMSRDCEVRYIITVDALKEGWDCPFAYILATLANKTSQISVEQILGRILRQPYTRRHTDPLLNLSYVFTCSNDFQRTLTVIVDGLNKSGFSGKDYVAAEKEDSQEENETKTGTDNTMGPLFEQDPSVLPPTGIFSGSHDRTLDGNKPFAGEEPDRKVADAANDDPMDDFNNLDAEKARTAIGKGDDYDANLESALQKADEYNRMLDTDSKNQNLMGYKTPLYSMKEHFAACANEMVLPQFFRTTTGNYFFESETKDVLLEGEHLLDDFRLELCDKNIAFSKITADAYQIDLEERNKDEYVPKMIALNDGEIKYFSSYFKNIKDERKAHNLTDRIMQTLRKKFDEINEGSLKRYVSDILENLSVDELDNLGDNILNTEESFIRKIKEEILKAKFIAFEKKLDTAEIFLKPSYRLPESIPLTKKSIGLTKSLYTEEDSIDGFEYKVIGLVANLDNVLFWHRNLEKGKGFFINGAINHYPDFIVRTKSGRMVLIETKGDHIDGSDSEKKVKLGRLWANKAGDNYRYFMVFDKKSIEGAYSLPDFINVMKGL